MTILFPLFALILALTMFGRAKYRRIYEEERKNQAPRLTGRELARRILDHAGLEEVEISVGRGPMPDFYDPARKRLTLARQHYDATTFTALGIAAHEAGHALQHREGFRPLWWRLSAVRATMYLSLPLLVVCLAALLIPGKIGIFTLVVGWSLLATYNLVTMPTEMDASQRSKVVLREIKPFRNLDEKIGVDRMMRIASAAYIEGASSPACRGWSAWWRHGGSGTPSRSDSAAVRPGRGEGDFCTRGGQPRVATAQ